MLSREPDTISTSNPTSSMEPAPHHVGTLVRQTETRSPMEQNIIIGKWGWTGSKQDQETIYVRSQVFIVCKHRFAENMPLSMSF